MATFISVPLKKTSEVDLAKPLTKFIQSMYPAGDDRADYCRAAEELSKLRKSSVGRPLDKHESSLETVMRYYDQLCAVEPKFPFTESQLCLTFTWKDAFDKGSIFGGSVKLALPSLGYEKTCVLFNIGALASQIASEQNLDNDEALKAASRFYQLASGAFSHIKDTVLSSLNREPTVDISPDTVGTLSLIMLAQAQEVFFIKATQDKLKDALIAKLANQAADYYGDAFKQCQNKDTLPKYFYFQEVIPVLAAKHCIMQAHAEYHQSVLAKQQKKFGEEIGRLQHASDLVKTVASRYDEYVNVKDLADKINRALVAAKKDNDFIYHDKVPDLKELEPIGKASIVKSTPVVVPLSQKYNDLFEKMVPLAVQQSLSAYNQRKAELINSIIAQMRDSTTLSNAVLASLNLPAAIEDVSGDSIPQSILQKSKAVIEQGGIQTIDQLSRDLPELLQRNKEILEESLKFLDVEEASDNDLKSKFKERWQRTPSTELYKPLRSEGTNFRNVLDKAVGADAVVKERYLSHREAISILCKPEAQLNSSIPSANPAKTMQGSEDSYQDFSKMKQSNSEANLREEVLKKLAVGHDHYIELVANLREGTKFYNDLTEILLKFQGKCSDIVFARKTERDELLKDLQQSIAREPSAPSIPVAPSYQAAPPSTSSTTSTPTPAPRTVFSGKQPPPRPPPPTIPASTPASVSAVQMTNPEPPAAVPAQMPPQAPSNTIPSQAQGPPYPTYPGYQGYYGMPMPVGYNPYMYGQQTMPPYMYQPQAGQAPYPAQQPGYPYPQQPYFPPQ
uniref:Programmed cell death 6-interacting protein n=1 Tax=Leptobrachium leishanense TaxID=445787 RepID=A0A8C5MR09_9ANUR